MILKFIECTPKPGMRADFSKAQMAWAPIAGCDGFIAQFGGWDSVNGHAIILALWQSEQAVVNFMASVHDGIFAGSGQEHTYQQCKVQYFTLEQDLEALQPAWLLNATSVRIEQYPGHMKQTKPLTGPGLLGGVWGRSNQESGHCLRLSFWHDGVQANEPVGDMQGQSAHSAMSTCLNLPLLPEWRLLSQIQSG
ncbi:DUF4937 domain-containing protein [Shewanella sedimentimangrovi]|uniref:DUF4937 domain-containing protein n=1 Tax=Shewanella sedimentimangrovi TaxID=2814293 RepID=A0ABX7R0U3_9GAMM|nr:DUF4937 domain-containing protein [Shewanella sedimentimangrovi]QSX37409.1 DUF4937 domain-containing protein [Shewanella sedimentimangrovi]